MLVNIAATRELGKSKAPVGWIWRAGRDIAWNAVAREEPDADATAGPFCGVDTAIVSIEAAAECFSVGGSDGAASIACGSHITICAQDSAAGKTVIRDGAASIGV